MWKKWWAPASANKWQMGFNSAFKGLRVREIYEAQFKAFAANTLHNYTILCSTRQSNFDTIITQTSTPDLKITHYVTFRACKWKKRNH